MRKTLKIAAVAGLLLASSSAAYAHHSAAMFDFGKTVTLQGTIKEFQWTNPHSWIQVVVKDDAGKEAEWSIESAAPNGLLRQGWTRTSLKPGDKASVIIHPLKNGNTGGFLIEAQLNGVKVGN